ncbi:hypothetical protein COCSUDRAFT_32532 [Coccomyxa subellipsoidea C-169]|uniref:Uncharacterized protein n=1 Tax=Coccomyxa subellipsoidea (strain C-169) TaxID=574566 RepID=I0Z2X3_COCSC|nr:hypothetical protein COCSUDRAFT_32532 [Coccomyxa subellipsoidea C-169]EIE24992.1 hypothetical protein COCSUDRAFT_32532 [Coccomyxa subellipsoidea C-169]|eukprot:XP_005649536.1 hypothetical protein COCSUDRAFT_32532 [Coccomyxa subellipsoidea C-169]
MLGHETIDRVACICRRSLCRLSDSEALHVGGPHRGDHAVTIHSIEQPGRQESSEGEEFAHIQIP